VRIISDLRVQRYDVFSNYTNFLAFFFAKTLIFFKKEGKNGKNGGYLSVKV
jgi:hypothetical protein